MKAERGLALAAVLFVLVTLGVVVVVSFLGAHLEQRTGSNTLYAVEAMEAAEAGVAAVLGEWEAVPQLAALEVGENLSLPAASLGARAAYQATAVRLTAVQYLIRSEGIRTDAGGGLLARRAVAVVARVTGGAVAPLLQRSWAQAY